MSRHRVLVLAALAACAPLAALADCGGDSVVADAGGDAPAGDSGPPADSGSDQAAPDAGPDVAADSGAPACDLKKNFGSAIAVKLQNNASPIVANGFRVRGGLAYVHAQATNKVQQGPYGNASVGATTDVFSPINIAGFDVSADGLTLTESLGLSIARSTRASTAVAFGAPGVLSVSMPAVDASIQVWDHVSGTGQTLHFARAENSTGPFTVDIFRATQIDAGAYASTNEIALHDGGVAYVARPVPQGDTRMYLAGWAGAAPQYQRLYVSTRASAQAPWSAPAALTVDGLTPQTGDQIVPLDVSADDCVLWYGVGTGVDGPYSVYEARRPK